MKIRPILDHERSDLHPINLAGEPGVGSLTSQALVSLSAKGTTLVALAHDSIVGFILVLEPGSDYRSPNYRWFEERKLDLFGPRGFAYVDRIAVSPEARNRGIGTALYQAVIAHFDTVRDAICAEINLIPPHPGSMRFHKRLGFEEVGEHVFEPGAKAVCYLAYAPR